MTRMLKLSSLLVLGAFVATAASYRHLPDPMPIHFDVNGRPNSYASLPWGALIVPFVMTAMLAVLALARAAVARQRGERAAVAVDVVGLAVQAFQLVIHVVVLRYATGDHLDVGRITLGSVALLLAVIGNWFGKLPRNAVVGIRVPRTLADDETWLMTHRFAGRVFVLGGLLIGSAALCGAPPAALIVGVVAMVMLPVVYAYTFRGGSR